MLVLSPLAYLLGVLEADNNLNFDFLKTLTLILLLLFGGVSIMIPTASYAISLDDDEEDAEDVTNYLQQARASAKKESFNEANRLLNKAKAFGMLGADIKETESYIATKKKERDNRIEKERLAKLEKERKEKERLARIEREREQQNSYSSSSSSSSYSSSSSTLDFVMIDFDVTCGLLSSCFEQNLQISGISGKGNFSPNYNNAHSGAIHKGYDGTLAGQYSWSAEFKNFDKIHSCSGSFYISGTKRNYAIRVYDNCNDASSGEW